MQTVYYYSNESYLTFVAKLLIVSMSKVDYKSVYFKVMHKCIIVCNYSVELIHVSPIAE